MDKLWIIHGNMDKLTLWIVVRHGGVLTMWARDTFCSKSTFWDAQKTLLTNLPTSWSPFLSLWFFHHVLKKIIWVSAGFKKSLCLHPGWEKTTPVVHQVFTRFIFHHVLKSPVTHWHLDRRGWWELRPKGACWGITPKKIKHVFSHSPAKSKTLIVSPALQQWVKTHVGPCS